MTKLDSNFWGNRRWGNISPGNGGGVSTTNPKPLPEDKWRPEQGQLVQDRGQFVGEEPNGPAAGNKVRPERGAGGA